MDCIARCGVYAESLATRQPVPVIPLSPPHTLALSLLCWTHHHTHKDSQPSTMKYLAVFLLVGSALSEPEVCHSILES
jgi:hypothetical protein